MYQQIKDAIPAGAI